MEIEEESQEEEKIKKIKSRYNIEKIRSKDFIHKIFYFLQKKKSIKIIKYNKKMQNRINLNFLEVYYELFSPIEIEIIPKIDKFDDFIHIPYIALPCNRSKIIILGLLLGRT